MVLLVAYKCSKIVFALSSIEINAVIIGERKMVKQKQRWTRDEEEALSAGVEKHGQGKWKLILTDPQFAPYLVNRSNIDLKDKWRNMTVCGPGSTSRERVRTSILGLDLTMNGGPSTMLEGVDLNLTESGVGSSSTNRVGTVLGLDLNLPVCSPEPSSVLPLVVYGGTPETSRSTVDRREAPDYEAMIFEALSTIQDPNGLDETAILNFIEERYELPQNYKRSVISMLRRLVMAGYLKKEVGNRYKYKTSGQVDAIPMNVEKINEGENEEDDRSGQEDAIPVNVENINEGEDEIGRETPEDVANVATSMIAKSEYKKQALINSLKKVGVLEELLEESTVMLKIAEDIHERCKREGVVVLNI